MFGLTSWYFCLSLLFLSTTAQTPAEKGPSSVIPLSISPNTGYYCFLRCVANCVVEQKVSGLDNSSCSTQCHAYNTQLCNSSDKECWSSCKDLHNGTVEIPEAPRNVIAAYVTEPHPTPHEAVIRWDKVPTANFYIVQYIDKTDAFEKWSENGGNLTASNEWRFRKPALCPEYTFRVAAVNSFGVGPFSRSVDLPMPTPIVENPSYEVVSIDLLEKPFSSFAADDQVYNKTVRIVISYVPPSNWDLGNEITRVEPNFHVVELPVGKQAPLAPQMGSVPGKPQFEITLPGDIAFTEQMSTVLFEVDRMYTKCNPGRSVEYPRTSNLLIMQFNCQNVTGGICPGAKRIIPPNCRLEPVIPLHECANDSFANVTVTFTRPKTNRTILYYEAIYGPIVRQVEGGPFPTYVILDNRTQLTLSNDTTAFIIPELLPLNRDYGATICAVFDERSVIDWNINTRFTINPPPNKKSNICAPKKASGLTTVAVAAPLTFLLLMALLVVTILYLKTRRRHTKTLAELQKHRNPDDNENGYVDMPRLYDRWEIPRSHLTLYDDQKLGSGAFGAVYKGKIRGRALMNKLSKSVLAEEWMKAENCDVAVKMLPEYADEGAKSEFRKEINLMKQLGYHERLVNMLCCITADEPLCLVVEFCSDGDLLHYLRDRCKYMVKLQENGIDLSNLPEDHDVDLNNILTIKDLLMFSWQICVGLEYLSEKNYIHRDVAARNVMVDVGKRAKIGDFGLCRYSCSDPIYMGKGGRLPWKWMALEAIKNYEFTTKSDVWSFGVLLFEIVTLGGSPYPGVDPGIMEKYLEDGNRLAQPDNCPDDFYALMVACWNADQEKRPSFSELRERLSKQLEVITEDYSYLHLNQSRDYYNMMQYNSRPHNQDSFDELDERPATNESILCGNNEAATSFVNRAFETDLTNQRTHDSRYHAPVTKSSSYPAQNATGESRRTSGDSGIPSDAASVISAEDNGHILGLGGSLHPDSAGSEQMLISLSAGHATSKLNGGSRLNKFFKLKPSLTSERLDTLPESTSSGGGTESRKQSVDVEAVNPVYVEHLLMDLDVDNQQTALSMGNRAHSDLVS